MKKGRPVRAPNYTPATRTALRRSGRVAHGISFTCSGRHWIRDGVSPRCARQGQAARARRGAWSPPVERSRRRKPGMERWNRVFQLDSPGDISDRGSARSCAQASVYHPESLAPSGPRAELIRCRSGDAHRCHGCRHRLPDQRASTWPTARTWAGNA
jgi:hypothetical protein